MRISEHTCPLVKSEIIWERHNRLPPDSYAVSKCALCTTEYPISRFKGAILWDLRAVRDLPGEFRAKCEGKCWLHLIFTLGL